MSAYISSLITSEVTGSPHHGNAGKISIPVETVPSINVSAILPHKNESQSSCSPPASEGDDALYFFNETSEIVVRL